MVRSIIVEAGATKSDWVVIDGNGNRLAQFRSRGINVSAMRMDEVKSVLSEVLDSEHINQDIKGVYIYVAGVVTEPIRAEIISHIQSVLPSAEVDVQDDLMGAARAVCGKQPGIVAILGTGSNACRYDGKSITRNVYSGGYILGDEGGAAALGKMFLSDYLKDIVPAQVAADFAREFDASYSAIVEGVYRSASPSGYLGSLAPFILQHMDDEYMARIIRCNLESFADRFLSKYETDRLPVGVVGGFAWACQDMLMLVLKERGIRLSRILKSPIDGLVDYHSGC